MAKFKVSYKMLKEQTGVVAEISKQLLGIADEMEGVASQLDGESATQGLSRLLRDASANMHGYTDGLGNMGKTMQQIIDKYTKTENNNSKRVDGAKAHNRDFYKNAVSVPSASVGSGGGGSSSSATSTVTVNVAPAAAATTAAAPAFSGGSVSTGSGAVPVAASAAAAAVRPTVVLGAASSTSAGAAAGVNPAAVAGAAAAGAAVAGAAVAAGVSKKKKGKVAATTAPTSQDKGLADAERRLEEAIANANQLK